MTCHRCRGLMCPAELRDWGGSPSQDSSQAFRCLACGEIEDPIIRSNRIGAQPMRSKRKWNKRGAAFKRTDSEESYFALRGSKDSLEWSIR